MTKFYILYRTTRFDLSQIILRFTTEEKIYFITYFIHISPSVCFKDQL